MTRQSKIKAAFQDVWFSRDEDGTSCWRYNVNMWVDKPSMGGGGMYEVADCSVSWIGALTLDEFEKLFGFVPKFGSCELCRVSVQPRSGAQVHTLRKSKPRSDVSVSKAAVQQTAVAVAVPVTDGRGRIKLKLQLKK